MIPLLHTHLLLQQLPGIGASVYPRLVEEFDSIEAIYDAEPALLVRLLNAESAQILGQIKAVGFSKHPLLSKVAQDLAWAENNGVQIIHIDMDSYPELLRETRRAPPVLYVAGDISCLTMPQVAMVGSRNPTPVGKGTAFKFAETLAGNGFTITSGLAIGIDTCAHKGALAAGGRTIAVLGSGIDHIYPSSNRGLAQNIIASGGAVLSEFPLGTGPAAQNFPQRNRIVSGLSYGVIVVEAAVKSGSLLSAKYAIQQNRELFAIPGSIHSPLSRGCHKLIKDGAKLVETAQDVVEELKGFLSLKWEQVSDEGQAQFELPMEATTPTPQLKNASSSKAWHADKMTTVPSQAMPSQAMSSQATPSQVATTQREESILAEIGYEATPIDVIVKRTRISIADVMASLLTMELKGLVANDVGGYIKLGEIKPAVND